MFAFFRHLTDPLCGRRQRARGRVADMISGGRHKRSCYKKIFRRKVYCIYPCLLLIISNAPFAKQSRRRVRGRPNRINFSTRRATYSDPLHPSFKSHATRPCRDARHRGRFAARPSTLVGHEISRVPRQTTAPKTVAAGAPSRSRSSPIDPAPDTYVAFREIRRSLCTEYNM